jgi:hypothetical protein
VLAVDETSLVRTLAATVAASSSGVELLSHRTENIGLPHVYDVRDGVLRKVKKRATDDPMLSSVCRIIALGILVHKD